MSGCAIRDARDQLRIAYELFGTLGAEAFAERARIQLRAVGGHTPKRTARTPDALTAQEAQIARLAAQGATNPEIAARLFISPIGASPYAPGTAPHHHSAPARRPTADRITHSNEKRLLSISKSRRTPTLSSGAAVNIYGAERTDQGFRRDRTHLTIGGL